MIENHNDRLLNQLRQHPEREPRAEIKNRLKTNLREKAQIMDRKQSFYPVLKIAGVSLASVFIIILLVSSGLEPLKNSMNQFLGSGGGSETPIVDISDEVTDETVVPPGEEEPIENKMLVLEEMYQDLLDKDVWDEAAQTFVDYLQAVFANDQQAIDVLSFTDFKGEEQINELVLFYEKKYHEGILKGSGCTI
ncbi:MAG: hypothetical protein LRY73_12065 [Bacillus sp. (in: Bacteria)]|nr:hypothetical protein [Bacillus sp. (in: firmicutes)]